MPNSTTMRIVSIELSVLRFRALLTSAIRPVATCDTTAMMISGISAMIGLRKMISSNIKMSASVASSTICCALFPDCELSRSWAACPVTPSVKVVPATSGLISARNVLIASSSVVPEPLSTLFGMATVEDCTTRFGDAGPPVTPAMPLMSLRQASW